MLAYYLVKTKAFSYKRQANDGQNRTGGLINLFKLITFEWFKAFYIRGVNTHENINHL